MPRMLNIVGNSQKADINKALATVEDNDTEIKPVIEDLGALTQQSVANLDTSLRGQVEVEIIDLRTAIDRVGSGGGPPTSDVL